MAFSWVIKGWKMLKLSAFRWLVLGSLFGAGLLSCTMGNKPEPADFEAKDADFAGFDQWALAAKTNMPSDLLKQAHGGTDPSVTRFVYVKDNAKRKESGQFPVGTIIVKRMQKPDGSFSGASAMVKRGSSFDPANNNWEYFGLDVKTGGIAKRQDGTINRGKTAACINCHVDALAQDFVFSVK
jgi:hypothetical protein